MAERDVVKYPNDVLRKQAKTVSRLDALTRQLVDDMVKTMRATNGLGLAANQVGVLQKVFVYDDGSGLGVLVNPEIISSEGEQLGLEGCLSVPGLQGEVNRAMKVTIKGQDLKGKSIKISAEGLLARIFQHELDHLHGRLFIDRAEPGSLYTVSSDDDDEDEE